MSSSTLLRFVTFRLGEQLYGVDVLSVKEVTTETTHTPIPHAPAQVVGYVNLRGQLHLMLDLRQMLGMTPTVIGSESRLVIYKPAVGEAFGTVVDAVGDIVELPREQYEDNADDSSLIDGIAKLERELVVVLEPSKFLTLVAQALAE